jgi:hypothetical protein
VSTNLTLIVILVSVIHVAVLAIMIWIRVRPTEGDGKRAESAKITPCAVCGEPAIGLSYDGLDPNEQRNPETGKAWSPDMTRYRPACAVHWGASAFGTCEASVGTVGTP